MKSKSASSLFGKEEKKMLNHHGVLLVLPLLAVLVAALPGQAQGRSCKDISLAVTFATPISPGISSDGLGAYVDGQSGVSAKIQICGTYYDAVIQLGAQNSTRNVTYDFSGSTVNYIPGVTPQWTQSSSPFLAKPLFNVNQIADNVNLASSNPAYYRPGANYTFTTYMWNGGITSPDGGKYALMYVSSDPVSDTGFGFVNTSSSVVNTPYSTSLVQVTHYAATGSSPETWVVVPIANCSGTCDADQYPGVVATLLSVTSTRNTTTLTNVGQFNMPFQMTLTRR